MKKFCSKCGNQLDLSQRFCSKCGAYNPFYISGFSKPDNSQTTNNEEQNIKPEAEDDEAKRLTQGLLKQQEGLKKEIEKLEKQNREIMEKERLLLEAEREKIEVNLRREIMSVKEEAEGIKKEAFGKVKEAKEELEEIEQENKRLKVELKTLSETQAANTAPAGLFKEQKPVKKSQAGRVVLIVSALFIVAIGSGLTYFYLSQSQEIKPGPVVSATKPVNKIDSVSTAAAPVTTPVNDTVKSPVKISLVAVTTQPPLKTAVPKPVTTPPPAREKKPLASADSAANHPKTNLKISENRVKSDLVGVKLSGCDVVVKNASEIKDLSHLALVEKLPSGELKYKFTAKISQGAENYTANPYIYYSGDGHFIKIDGTNCE